jgi:hypothetical protein
MRRCEKCGERHYALGLCRRHYDLSRNRSGSQRNKQAPVCSVDGCNGRPHARNYCPKHYRRWLLWGHPDVVVPRIGRAQRLCSVDGCLRPYYVRGLCIMHYARQKRRELGIPEKKRLGTCCVSGCRLDPVPLAVSGLQV